MAINPGMLIQTTNVWDASRLYEIEVGSPEFKELLVRLYQNINLIAVSLNNKDTGLYETIDEVICGQTYFSDPALNSTTSAQPIQRPVFRKVINFGALPNTAPKTAAHGIAPTTSYSFTRMYATATDPVNKLYIPIPYASSTAGKIIELSADATNVTITTASNLTAYTVCYVVLEYITT